MKYSGFSVRRFAVYVAGSLVAAAVVLFVSPGVGSQPIDVFEAWRHWLDVGSGVHTIAFSLRLPRAVTAMVAGMTLALCGGVFQSLFRNVLATPYTLGVASGGALGAVISLKLGLSASILGLSSQSWCALAGSAAVVALVFLLAGTAYRISGNALVLAGVTIGLFCGSLIMFVTYIADVRETFFAVRWMMGSLETHGYGQLTPLLPPLLVSWLVLLGSARALNQFDLGDEIAASRGVRLLTLQLTCIGFASIATACVVSICGPVGFVGLIIPHVCRLVLGRDHRLLLPVAAIWGGVFLVVCDWLARLAPIWYGSLMGREASASALPIGVMTSLIGAPVFLVLLARSRRGR